ncbi:tyrosine-protein phosphatase non-receptor type 23-like [Eriocheir sinensis]|uniref:tyrosine-protein phosphatase non-receptor type 23-like n=1 Tax=Eriocheir sinensis TaxID=95602 RepID=UPI0021C8C572|nr:tyrosine-protein phosphatase non-receptor type 23-like [Eriocheir sinensis]
MPSQGVMFPTYSGGSHPSCELLTTFSPGPVVVTQVTSARSSRRSSPLMRKSSTRSAPGGSSPRRTRPRAASCRGGPVHVLEVEADDITTPRVEIHSPSRLSRLSLRNLRRRESQPIMNRESQSVLSLPHSQEVEGTQGALTPSNVQPQPQSEVQMEQSVMGLTEEQIGFDTLQPPQPVLEPQPDVALPPEPQAVLPPLTAPYVHLTPPPGHVSPAPLPQQLALSPQVSQHHLSPHPTSHPLHHPPPQPLHPQIHTVSLPQVMYPAALPHMAPIPVVEPPPQSPLTSTPQLHTSALLLRTTPQYTITIPHGTYTPAGIPPSTQEGLAPSPLHPPPPPPRHNTIATTSTSLPHVITTLSHFPQNATPTPTSTVLYTTTLPPHHHHHYTTAATTLPRGGCAGGGGGTLSRLASQIHPSVQGAESGVPLQVLYLPQESAAPHLSLQETAIDPLLCTSTGAPCSSSTSNNNVHSTFRYSECYLSS